MIYNPNGSICTTNINANCYLSHFKLFIYILTYFTSFQSEECDVSVTKNGD